MFFAKVKEICCNFAENETFELSNVAAKIAVVRSNYLTQSYLYAKVRSFMRRHLSIMRGGGGRLTSPHPPWLIY